MTQGCSASLLLPINKAGRIEDRWLSSQAVFGILQRVGESAGVDGFVLHDMRRTFITLLAGAGAAPTRSARSQDMPR